MLAFVFGSLPPPTVVYALGNPGLTVITVISLDDLSFSTLPSFSVRLFVYSSLHKYLCGTYYVSGTVLGTSGEQNQMWCLLLQTPGNSQDSNKYEQIKQINIKLQL